MKLKSLCGPRRSLCTYLDAKCTHIVYLWPFRFLLGLGHIRTLFAITDHGLELGVEKKPLRTLYIYIYLWYIYYICMCTLYIVVSFQCR